MSQQSKTKTIDCLHLNKTKQKQIILPSLHHKQLHNMSLIVIIESSGWFLQWNACIKNTQQILGYCVASHQVKLLLAMLATQSTVLAPLSAIPLLIQLLPNAS